MNTGMVIGVSVVATISIVLVTAMALGYKISGSFSIAKPAPPRERAAAAEKAPGKPSLVDAGAA